MHRSTLYACLLLMLGSWPSIAQKDTTKLRLGPLFKKEEVLELTMLTNLKTLMKDRGEKPVNHWAMLSYQGKDKLVSLKIKTRVRGNFRKSPANCVFPPLLLNIPNKKDKNTIFERQNRLKLVTHCQNEAYIFQEYLTYKAYNLLTDCSFKARLARVTYKDSAGNREPQTRYAFLLEDELFLAKRNGLTNFNLKNMTMPKIDSLSMATVAVFEYMIGNTDWSVPYLHNIRLLARQNGILLAVPYDFDHSGLVEAKYARPAEELLLSSVRERLYRGITYSPAVFNQVFEKFRSIKPQLYGLYQDNPNLSASYIKRVIKYLDEFYETINDPKSLKYVFVTGGGRKQDNVVVKGLK
jgi:hypothetical protein